MTRARSKILLALLLALTTSILGVAGTIRVADGMAASISLPAAVQPRAFSHLVFVAGADSRYVEVVDTQSDKVVAALPVGVTVDQIAVSDAAGALVVANKAARELVIYDAVRGAIRVRMSVDFVPSRLAFSPDGYIIAAIDPVAGTLGLFSVQKGTAIAVLSGLGPISDITFEPDGAFIYVSRRDRPTVVAIDVAGGSVVAEFAAAMSVDGEDGIVSLARTPTDRFGFARFASGRVGVFDLLAMAPVRLTRIETHAERIYPTGYGGYLILPDPVARRIAIVSTVVFDQLVSLPGPAQPAGVSSAFLDTVAFVGDRAERRLHVVDLTTLKAAGTIDLGGTPRQGVVTPDGAKLYVPLEEGGIAVVDTVRRVLLARISAGQGAPPLVAIARSYDICH